MRVVILYNILIVTSDVEGPNLKLIQAMIDDWHVSVGRVGVQTFTLDIVEEEFHIVIFSRDDW